MSTRIAAGGLGVTADLLRAWVRDARERALELVGDLTEEQLLGPRLKIVNPLKWEVGHAAWFCENRVLERALGLPPVLPNGAALYDSTTIRHAIRWDLPLPSKAGTLEYLRASCDAVLRALAEHDLTERLADYTLYGIYHEDMHNEAVTYTRQTLAYALPRLSLDETPVQGGGPYPGDVEIPGGTLVLGAPGDGTFAHDNERPAQTVDVAPFAIARAAVTQGEFAAFVDDGGYRRRELWDDEGWAWRTSEEPIAPGALAGARREQPLYWRRAAGGGWERRHFDRWVPLEPHRAMVHVNWYEAMAYCRWAGRRLPSEAEWELAASGEPAAGGTRLSGRKRRYPWGDAPPAPERANLDWRGMGCVDVGAFPQGDSAFGCRQMIGNVWEWTSDTFRPFPGFQADEAYPEYSAPWFETRKVLRGGCWATRSRLIRNTWRNFYTPDRSDVWAGFRTCAL